VDWVGMNCYRDWATRLKLSENDCLGSLDFFRSSDFRSFSACRDEVIHAMASWGDRFLLSLDIVNICGNTMRFACRKRSLCDAAQSGA
jgi:hypothetical protein